VASIVAVVAGVIGFFVVLRGAAFVADAVPQGAFTGAAAASLLGINTLTGLAVASLAGALLIFSLMIGPPAAARSVTSRPLPAMLLWVLAALIVVWLSIAAAYQTNWPVGFFVGTLGAVCYAVGRSWAAVRRHRSAPADGPPAAGPGNGALAANVRV
jgi:zinc/manganese transport system permease protein